MTSFQFATRITNAILSGQSHVNFCYRIMCRFNLFAIIRMRFKPLARRNFLCKKFLTSSKRTQRRFFYAKCQIELNFAFRPVSKRFWPKNCLRLTYTVWFNSVKWSLIIDGNFLSRDFSCTLSWHFQNIAQNNFGNISIVRPLVLLSLK